jgi:hypothetical protein
VAGVTVSGPRIGREPLRIRGFGAARGTLRVGADGRATGRLGGRRVRGDLASCLPARLAGLEFELPGRRRLAHAAFARLAPQPRLRVR